MLFVHIGVHFLELIRVAELLRDSRDFRPIVHVRVRYEGYQKHIARCREEGIEVLTPDDFDACRPPEKQSRWAAWRARTAAAAIATMRPFLRPLAAYVGAPMAAIRRFAAYEVRIFRFDSSGLEQYLRWRLQWLHWRFGLIVNSRPVQAIPAPIRRAVRASLRVLWLVARTLWRSARTLWRAVRPLTLRLRAFLNRPLPAPHVGLLQFLYWIGRLLRDGSMAVARPIGRLLWRVARKVLLLRIPALDELPAMRHAPPWLRKAVDLLGAAALLFLPLRPLARFGVLAAFGLFYRRLPNALPLELKELREVDLRVPRFLDVYAPDLLVLPEDNFYYFTNLFVKRMHERNRAVVIVPFTIVNVLEWAEAFRYVPSHDANILLNRMVAVLFPRWLLEHRGKRLYMQATFAVACEYLGVAPPQPWLINSGATDAIAVESRFMERYYLDAGIPPSKLHFTGALTDDLLYRAAQDADARREALYLQLGLPPGRPMILCAMPPNQLLGGGRPVCEFQDYRDVIRAFIEPLERLADEYNVVVNLHPRILAFDAELLSGKRLRISRANIVELVPLAKIYVASCSATIRLAITCGIPVVNYDVYRYDYDDFKRVPGVIAMEEKSVYAEAIHRLANSRETYADAHQRQLQFAREETILDGQAGARMLDLFNRFAHGLVRG